MIPAINHVHTFAANHPRRHRELTAVHPKSAPRYPIPMGSFVPRDPEFASKTQKVIAAQPIMDTVGAYVTLLAPGHCEIEMPVRPDLAQQHGSVHAAILTLLLDNATGGAAQSLMEPDQTVVTVEYKVNFLAPAHGEKIVARGRVTKPGRNITVCTGDVFGVEDGQEKLAATMLATMMGVRGRDLVR